MEQKIRKFKINALEEVVNFVKKIFYQIYSCRSI